jgi:outer membrane receptor protein involved in Fe transport
MRLAIFTAASSLVVSMAIAANARASIKMPVDIPPEPLELALKTLAKDRGFQVVYRTEVVGSARTRGVRGQLSTAEALTKLLEGTRLAYAFLDDNTITITRTDFKTGTAASPDASAPSADPKSDDRSEGQKSSSLRLAQLDQGTSSNTGSVSADQANAAEPARDQEVVVTAQKKGAERVQDVPVPISVLNAESLSQNNQVLIRDYYATVPSLSVSPSELGQQQIAIRGVTAGNDASPTVGILIDDMPYGSSVSAAGFIVPDIDPGDLARIEVLRGPQGTLYGADSLGGLIKFVTKEPTTDAYSGRIEAGTSYSYNGNDPGYNLRASANIPATDELAFRISGFTRQDPGYVDNTVSDLQGVNVAESEGGRLAALWRPAQDLSIKLSALYQYTRGDGSSEVDRLPGTEDVDQNFIPLTGSFDRKVQAYSATVDYKLGGITLTSVTGYSNADYNDVQDLTPYFGSLAQSFFQVSGGPFYDHDDTEKDSQELRFAGTLWQDFDWLAGGFYTHEHTAGDVVIGAANSTTGAFAGEVADLNAPFTFQESAAFADLTYRFTERFDLQLGGRESQYTNRNDTSVDSGPLYGKPASVTPPIEAKANAFTYLVTPRLKLSPDTMLYARFASGYRPGGPNGSAAVQQGAPTAYTPDKTKNYEIGIKASAFDQALTIDASVYYIDWKGIQLNYHTTEGFGYIGNGGGAKSEGAEFSVVGKPTASLTLSAWVAFDNAVLTDSFGASATVYGGSGDRLPDSSRWSGNFSLNQDFPLSGQTTGFVGAVASYVGNRQGYFTGAPEEPAPRQYYPSYTKTDLRAGIRYEEWTAAAYVNNAANVHGILSGGIGYTLPNAYFDIPPRIIGVTVSRQF